MSELKNKRVELSNFALSYFERKVDGIQISSLNAAAFNQKLFTDLNSYHNSLFRKTSDIEKIIYEEGSDICYIILKNNLSVNMTVYKKDIANLPLKQSGYIYDQEMCHYFLEEWLQIPDEYNNYPAKFLILKCYSKKKIENLENKVIVDPTRSFVFGADWGIVKIETNVDPVPLIEKPEKLIYSAYLKSEKVNSSTLAASIKYWKEHIAVR
jgi:hypothetical protein